MESKPGTNAVKLAGEAFLPGASLLMEGKVAQGGAHLLVGVLAKALLGPAGLVLVIANSYANSTTGKGLLKHIKSEIPTRTETPAAAAPATPATPVTPVKP
jgi:hypothetical protein